MVLPFHYQWAAPVPATEIRPQHRAASKPCQLCVLPVAANMVLHPASGYHLRLRGQSTLKSRSDIVDDNEWCLVIDLERKKENKKEKRWSWWMSFIAQLSLYNYMLCRKRERGQGISKGETETNVHEYIYIIYIQCTVSQEFQSVVRGLVFLWPPLETCWRFWLLQSQQWLGGGQLQILLFRVEM